jgi:hypothetical protein
MNDLSQVSYKPPCCARVSLTWLAIASTRVSGMSVSDVMSVAEETAVSLNNRETV